MISKRFSVFLLCLLFSLLSAHADEKKNASIFAAASLRDVINDVAEVFEKDHTERIHFNFAGSNVLAQQITAGARADVYLSANQQWVDFVEKKTPTVSGSRKNFLANRLVIVAHENADISIDKPKDLAKVDFRFLSMGNPEAVPAGKYAKRFLQSVKLEKKTLWDTLKERIAPAPDVREALHFVESDPSIIGIVYKTDAKVSKKTKVLYEITEEKVPIYYTATRINRPGSPKVAKEFYDFLFSEKAGEIFEKHGFTFVAKKK